MSWLVYYEYMGTNVNKQAFSKGNKVKVINPDSLFYGRTGYVEVLASYVGSAEGRFSGPPESRGWRVVFDWPLGGLGGVAVLREHELEMITRL